MSGTVPLVINEGEISTCPPNIRLPFDSSKTSKIGWGGYSTVYKEIIAIRHFKYRPKSSQVPSTFNEIPLPIARKVFPYTPDFEREYAFLCSLNESPHRHAGVIPNLAVLIHDDKYNLILPLAGCDLEQFLVSTEFSTFGLNHLLKQISNIAGAVSWLHSGIKTPDGRRLTACHMDLKPGNVLIFRGESKGDVGTWKITDFSTSTLTSDAGQELLPAPRLVAEVYSAPEIQKKPEKNKASPECDVWSLGCIIFEIIMVFADGREESMKWRDTWGNMPCFYEDAGDERVLASKVQRWLGAVPDTLTENQAVESCKHLILDILKIPPVERPTAKHVQERVSSISGRT